MAIRNKTPTAVQSPNNFGQLFAEWLVTMALRIECNNLHYIKHHQTHFRSQSMQGKAYDLISFYMIII